MLCLILGFALRQTPEHEVLIQGLLGGGPRISFEVRWCEERGRGVFALESINKGEYVVEYLYNKIYPR